MCFPSTGERCQNASKCIWSYYFCFGGRSAQLLCFHIQMGFSSSSSSCSPWQLLLLHLCREWELWEPGMAGGGLVPAVLWLLLQPASSRTPQDSHHFTPHTKDSPSQEGVPKASGSGMESKEGNCKLRTNRTEHILPTPKGGRAGGGFPARPQGYPKARKAGKDHRSFHPAPRVIESHSAVNLWIQRRGSYCRKKPEAAGFIVYEYIKQEYWKFLSEILRENPGVWKSCAAPLGSRDFCQVKLPRAKAKSKQGSPRHTVGRTGDLQVPGPHSPRVPEEKLRTGTEGEASRKGKEQDQIPSSHPSLRNSSWRARLAQHCPLRSRSPWKSPPPGHTPQIPSPF